MSWNVSTKLSGTLRTQTFKDAVTIALQQFNVIQNVQLIVDAGSENQNSEVNNWTNTVQRFLKKVIHLTDDFTGNNSAVEAVNAIVKNRYLNFMQIANLEQLKIALQKIVNDYNNQRPHTTHKGLTPNEVYSGIKDLPKYDDFTQHRQKRRTENKKSCCKL